MVEGSAGIQQETTNICVNVQSGMGGKRWGNEWFVVINMMFFMASMHINVSR